MVFKKVVIIDCRGHLLGRLASIVAKELLNGQKIVRIILIFYQNNCNNIQQ
jgi:large subunit ribosomal protein L13Ae